jgi:N-acetylglucosaminyl-diphospho-decaprenol L-rhamnosyltransferase
MFFYQTRKSAKGSAKTAKDVTILQLKSPMKLSIQIVHYRQEKKLELFLASIFNNLPSFSLEVIVVNNDGESEGFSRVMAKYSDKVRVIQSDKNLGYGGAIRVAMNVSEGEYVAICNCDLVTQNGAWDELVGYLDKHPQVGMVGPKLMYDNGKVQESYHRFPRLSDKIIKRLGLSRFFDRRMGKYLMRDAQTDQPFEVDWIEGAVMVMPRRVYDKVGGFDQRYFLFFEDTDLCRSVREKKYQVAYLPSAKLIHGHERLSDGGSFFKNLRKRTFWWHLASAFKYYLKWGRW